MILFYQHLSFNYFYSFWFKVCFICYNFHLYSTSLSAYTSSVVTWISYRQYGVWFSYLLGHLFFVFGVFFLIFIYLTEWQDRQELCHHGWLPKWSQQPGQGKVGARNLEFHLESPIGVAGTHGTEPSSAAFPSSLAGSWIRKRAGFKLAFWHEMLLSQVPAQPRVPFNQISNLYVFTGEFSPLTFPSWY